MIGMRTIKTGLTVGLAALVARLINRGDPFVLVFTALVALESTVSLSLETGLRRMTATVVGALAAIVLLQTHFPLEIQLSLAVMLLILVTNQLGLKGTVGIAGTVTILIVLYGSAGDSPITIALIRLRDTFLGMAISALVNLTVFPPRPMKQLIGEEEPLYREMMSTVEETYLYGISDSLAPLKEEIRLMENAYAHAKAEIGPGRPSPDSPLDLTRKLIGEYQKIHTYAENLSYLGKDLRVTDDNHSRIKDLFGHDAVHEKTWDGQDSSPQEIIYNHTLKQLLNHVGKVLELRASLRDHREKEAKNLHN